MIIIPLFKQTIYFIDEDDSWLNNASIFEDRS